MNRVCNICNNEYPLTKDFFPFRKNNNSFRKECIKCNNKNRSLRKQNQKEKIGNILYNKKVNEYQKTHKEKRFKENICVCCNNIRLKNSTFCEKHYYMQLANKYLKDKNFWELLKNKLENQNYICPYTGKILVLGLNTSLDHMFPKKRFPEKEFDINNLQWVSLKINKIKSDFTHNEFISFILKIYNNRIKNENTI